MTPQPTLFPALSLRSAGDPARSVEPDHDVSGLLAMDAPVAIGISGGKDSCALAFAVHEHLDAIGHRGPRILIHADLGRVEWKDSAPTCQRLADRLNVELVTVRRGAGDMMDRWLSRWAANVERYRNLECVKLILPWSTPSMRFCTSELKTAVICRDLVRRFPGATILSAIGIRRQESSGRKHAPSSKPQTGLSNRARGTTGRTWNAIAHWSLDDVYACLAARQFALHEAYRVYGMTRVSCRWCIMSSTHDLHAATTCPDNHDLYREMVGLEVESTFAFQGSTWLGDVAPHLLDANTLEMLDVAKGCARAREVAENRIPKHLLYEKGWPKCVPTRGEAALLCDVRLQVAGAVGIEGVRYLEPDMLIGRYEDLIRERGSG